jgi:hypothetical protein
MNIKREIIAKSSMTVRISIPRIYCRGGDLKRQRRFDRESEGQKVEVFIFIIRLVNGIRGYNDRVGVGAMPGVRDKNFFFDRINAREV